MCVLIQKQKKNEKNKKNTKEIILKSKLYKILKINNKYLCKCVMDKNVCILVRKLNNF